MGHQRLSTDRKGSPMGCNHGLPLIKLCQQIGQLSHSSEHHQNEYFGTRCFGKDEAKICSYKLLSGELVFVRRSGIFSRFRTNYVRYIIIIPLKNLAMDSSFRTLTNLVMFRNGIAFSCSPLSPNIFIERSENRLISVNFMLIKARNRKR